MNKVIVFLLLLLFTTCKQEPTYSVSTKCQKFGSWTHLPRLFVGPSGLSLSFVRSLPADPQAVQPRHRLYVATWDEDHWEEAWNMREGSDWFVNWADFPSYRYYYDEQDSIRDFSHWLRYSGSGTYDYNIYYTGQGSSDGKIGEKFHQDTVSAEHGFLSSAQLPDGGLQVTWLDGRNTKQGAAAGATAGEGARHDHAHGGAMSLRTKRLGEAGSVLLDGRVCDCCNTATIATDSLTLVAYRDRSEHEIRDIGYVVRRTGSAAWSTPKLVHADNYEISGCPVNGPALAANRAGTIALTWWTAPAAAPQILFSTYDAAADRWAVPLVLDDDSPLGRVDLQLADDGTAYATGLTAHPAPDSVYLTLWTIAPDREVKRKNIAVTSAKRSSGFPKIALFEDRLYFARTVMGSEKDQHSVEVCTL